MSISLFPLWQALHAQTQWISFTDWNDGNSVAIESDSIVWVGTRVGLVRWNVTNGSYQTFDEEAGLMFPAVNAITLDNTNNLWIATDQGVVRSSNGTFSHFNHINSTLPQTKFTHIVTDSTGRIYAGFEAYVESNAWKNGGFAVYDGTSWQRFHLPVNDCYCAPAAMAIFHDTLWISGFGVWNKLYVFSNGILSPAPNWSGGGCVSIVADYDDGLWVNSDASVHRYKNGSWTKFDGVPGGWTPMFFDPRGGLWLTSYSPTLYHFSLSDFAAGIHRCSQWTVAGLCPVDNIPRDMRAHATRSANRQYFASFEGLYEFDGSNWTKHAIPKTLNDNAVAGLAVGPDGSMYISTASGTQKTDGSIWTTISGSLDGIRSGNNDLKFGPGGTLFTNHGSNYPNADSYSGYVTGLDFDGYGNLWATYPMMKFSWPGPTRSIFTPEAMGIFTPPNRYKPQFMDVCVDKTERVWAAAWYYGGASFDGKLWTGIHYSDSTLPNANYDYVFADSKGRVWFATNQWSPNYGFTCFDGENWKTYSFPGRYRLHYVYQITEDHSGNLWFATADGLLKYDNSTFSIYDNKNSYLSTNSTSAVAVDFAGNLWIGTNRGLYLYNPSGVLFNHDAFVNPVDSLVAQMRSDRTIVRFRGRKDPSSVLRYELQRGRGTHKFWSIAASAPGNSVIQLIDTTAPTGRYYYRVKEVSLLRKATFSPSIVVYGGTPSADITRFEVFPAGNGLLFQWFTSYENLVSRFEILNLDSGGTNPKLISSVAALSSGVYPRRYRKEAVVSLQPNQTVAIRAIFADMSPSDVRMADVIKSFPMTFEISKNYPNPFNSLTTFEFTFPAKGDLTFKVFDLLGRQIINLSRRFEAGYQSFTVPFEGLPSGVYFYLAEFEGIARSGKVMFVK